jgi:hypothetical protein
VEIAKGSLHVLLILFQGDGQKSTLGSNAGQKIKVGMTVLEAFMYATLSNNYMAWLYDYKHKNPASTVKTEYNLKEMGNNEEGTDNNDNEQIYCANLDETEIAVLNDDGYQKSPDFRIRLW